MSAAQTEHIVLVYGQFSDDTYFYEAPVPDTYDSYKTPLKFSTQNAVPTGGLPNIFGSASASFDFDNARLYVSIAGNPVRVLRFGQYFALEEIISTQVDDPETPEFYLSNAPGTPRSTTAPGAAVIQDMLHLSSADTNVWKQQGLDGQWTSTSIDNTLYTMPAQSVVQSQLFSPGLSNFTTVFRIDVAPASVSGQNDLFVYAIDQGELALLFSDGNILWQDFQKRSFTSGTPTPLLSTTALQSSLTQGYNMYFFWSNQGQINYFAISLRNDGSVPPETHINQELQPVDSGAISVSKGNVDTFGPQMVVTLSNSIWVFWVTAAGAVQWCSQAINSDGKIHDDQWHLSTTQWNMNTTIPPLALVVSDLFVNGANLGS